MQNMIFATGTCIACRVNMLKRLITLQRMEIFNDLDENYMDLLQPLFEPFSCQAGTTVLKQGMPANHIYLILSGRVEISFKPYDGTPITVSHLEKDGIFGWSAVVGSSQYTSSAIAIEELETFRIRGSELRKFCSEHPDAGRDILERLANAVSSRWKDAHEQVKSILVQGMKDR